jgi:hypothetical protein
LLRTLLGARSTLGRGVVGRAPKTYFGARVEAPEGDDLMNPLLPVLDLLPSFYGAQRFWFLCVVFWIHLPRGAALPPIALANGMGGGLFQTIPDTHGIGPYGIRCGNKRKSFSG